MPQAQRVYRPFPAIGEVFELTAMERLVDYVLLEYFGCNLYQWYGNAHVVTPGTRERFVLLWVGYMPNVAAAAYVCENRGGKPTNGLWLKVFDEAFGSNGKNIVGVPETSWLAVPGQRFYPVIDWVGNRYFRPASRPCHATCLWLQKVA